jgi:tripartite-type tricarboxylate transporter receptor subunit TctC
MLRSALVVLGLLFFSVAGAQEYPARPITIVVPFGPGGPSDIYARLVAQKLHSLLGATIVENVTGAGGAIGATRVASARPDGYTLLVGNLGTQVLAIGLNAKLPYDPQRDFVPVALLASDYIFLVSKKDLPAADLREFIAYLKANPGKASYSSAGAGSVSHVACAMLAQQVGASLIHVPYKSFAAAMQDLIRGEVDFACGLPGIVRSHVEAGTLRGLAIGGPERSPLLPNTPTSAEAGLPSFQVNSWNALFAPRATPAPIVARLNAAVRAALDDAEVNKRFTELGAIVPKADQRTSEALTRQMEADLRLWLPTMKSLALTRD